MYEKLGTDNIPGSPWRAVPNYNGYQADAQGNLVYTEPNYLDVDKPFLTSTGPGIEGGATHRMGCLYDPQFDFPVLSTTTQNGGNDFSGQAFVQHRNMYVIPWAYANVAHYRSAGSNGLRAPGEYKGGGILALDAKTGQVLWDNWDKSWLGLDMAHGQTTLATASDLVFVGRDDGYIIALDVLTGEILWKFQSGAGVEGGMATYSIDGEQYVVALSFVGWRLRDGVQARRHAGRASHAGVVGRSHPARWRRHADAWQHDEQHGLPGRARTSRLIRPAARDSIATGGMVPNNLGVPVGTTVTFRNPGAETFPLFPNLKEHCATQFFEGVFNPRLQPGQTFQYTFTREGEYWYNDCTDPRPTGRVNVTAAVVDLPGALQIAPPMLNLKPPTGIFTGVNGVDQRGVEATRRLHARHRLWRQGDDQGALVERPVRSHLGPDVGRRQDAGCLLRQGRARQQHGCRHCGSADGLRVVHEWRSAEAADVDGQRTGDEVSESALSNNNK